MQACSGLVTLRRYDVEAFQKIEALTGQKMEQYTAQEDSAMLLLERTGEAQRIASMQVLGATGSLCLVSGIVLCRSAACWLARQGMQHTRLTAQHA